MLSRSACVVLAAAVLMTACSGDDASPSPTDITPSTTVGSPEPTAAPTAPPTGVPDPRTLRLQCDPLDERHCLLPWPNDAFTLPDDTTATGRRLALFTEEAPRNTAGDPIDLTRQNLADGFSPASTILLFVPDLDPAASGLPDSTQVATSTAADSPVVLLDAVTGDRLAYWAELDAQAPPGEQLLMIRPAANLPEGHRIVVAVRDLVTTAGAPVERTTAYEAALEGTPEPEERIPDFARMFADLEAADIDPADLLLAWDFTVASQQSLSGPALAMRDQAFAAIDGRAPPVTGLIAVDAGGVRTVDGQLLVPNFLEGGSGPQGTGPGALLDLDAEGLPRLSSDTPEAAFPFRCVLPVEPAAPVPVIVYGHGLLGSRGEVGGLSALAASGAVALCAVDWIGMSSDDIANVATILDDLSRFPQQVDRMLQALVNVQVLAAAIAHPQGLVVTEPFRTVDDTPVIATEDVSFVGNSQGGILGGAASAVTDQWDRVVLGVPGSNYNLLLTRSSNWPTFRTTFEAAYSDPVERALALELVQLLWDRGENAGYAQHLTSDLLPGATAKSVLLIAAYGDHQVANVATGVLARTIGAAVRLPIVDDERTVSMFDLLSPLGESPVDLIGGGAALVVWDYGTPTSPPDNRAPTDPEYGSDPHGAGSSEGRVIQQALTLLFTGQVIDPCGAGACVSDALSR